MKTGDSEPRAAFILHLNVPYIYLGFFKKKKVFF